VPEQHFLSEDEAFAVALEFRRCHPHRLRLFATILGWGDLGSEAAVRELVRTRPFVSFRPAAEQTLAPAFGPLETDRTAPFVDAGEPRVAQPIPEVMSR
jgi:hypothetical protein